MARKQPKPARRVRTFKQVPDLERRNPASIRRFLFDLVVQEFDRSCQTASETLSGALHAAPQHRKHRRGFSAEAVYRVARDLQTVSFNQIDGMALHYGVPMALILLFTRVRSELDESESHAAQSALRVIGAFRSALDRLEEEVRALPVPLREVHTTFDHECFMSVREKYLDAYREEQPRLL